MSSPDNADSPVSTDNICGDEVTGERTLELRDVVHDEDSSMVWGTVFFHNDSYQRFPFDEDLALLAHARLDKGIGVVASTVILEGSPEDTTLGPFRAILSNGTALLKFVIDGKDRVKGLLDPIRVGGTELCRPYTASGHLNPCVGPSEGSLGVRVNFIADPRTRGEFRFSIVLRK